jgi:hypothetical protein
VTADRADWRDCVRHGSTTAEGMFELILGSIKVENNLYMQNPSLPARAWRIKFAKPTRRAD